MKRIAFLVCLFFAISTCGSVQAHPGEIDKYGGHWCNTSGWEGFTVGRYHYHSGPYAGFEVSRQGEMPNANEQIERLKSQLISTGFYDQYLGQEEMRKLIERLTRAGLYGNTSSTASYPQSTTTKKSTTPDFVVSQYFNVGTYTGSLDSKGLPSGNGTMVYKNGDSYTGEWIKGFFQGVGEYIWSGGDRYVGYFKSGKRDGFGTYQYKSGKQLSGYWQGDKYINSSSSASAPNNVNNASSANNSSQALRYVTNLNLNGGKYEGYINSAGYPQGKGTYTWASGQRYVGDWRDGSLNGQGTLTRPDGNKYVGAFQNNMFNGYGTYTWSNGEKYVGNFKDGKREGQGTYSWRSGQKYSGEWKAGLFHGQGTLTYANGTVEKGIWQSDKLVKRQ